MTIIGLFGLAGSGKTTAANHIVTNHGYEEYHFAKPMKDILMDTFQWEGIHMYGDLKEVVDKKWGFSPRQALQVFGTEFGRSLNPGLWLIFADDYMKTVSDADKVVISDVRFENEAEYCRRRGYLIHIIRPNTAAVGMDEHQSEKGIEFKDGDYRIFNDQGLTELYRKIDSIMTIIGAK